MSLEESISYHFKNPALLRQALTHRSFVNESGSHSPDNERLEFLGDAVINLVVSQYIFERMSDADEGMLTRARAGIVSRRSLADAARTIDLGKYLLMGHGARNRDKVFEQDSVLCGAFEALIGAVFLDSGFEAAQEVVMRLLGPNFSAPSEQAIKDPKSTLQELCQERFQALPKYEVLSRSGPDHDPTFEVEVVLPDGRSWIGVGRSRKEAEMHAASTAIEHF